MAMNGLEAAAIIKELVEFHFDVVTLDNKAFADKASAAYNIVFNCNTRVVESEEDDTSSTKFGAKRKVYHVRGF